MLCLLTVVLQLAAVLVVSDPAVQSALQSELPAICLLAKLDPTKVGTQWQSHSWVFVMHLDVVTCCLQWPCLSIPNGCFLRQDNVSS